MSINFGKTNIIAKGTNADIDTLEEDVVIATDIGELSHSQVTVYFDYDLGTHTSLEIRYYFRSEVDGSWYQSPIKNEVSGSLKDIPSVIDSDTPASRVIEDFPLSSCWGFKITAKGVGGANGSLTATVLKRNN